MTSLSRRKPRTTAWRTTLLGTGISLAALAAGAQAADPVTAPQTHWVTLPTVPPSVAPPAPLPPSTGPSRPAPPDTPPMALPAVPGRTVSFQKPTGSTTPAPAEAVAMPPAAPVKANIPPIPRPFSDGTGVPPLSEPPPAPPKPPESRLPIGTGKDPITDMLKAFRFESDEQLARRIVNELMEEDRERALKTSDRPPNPRSYYDFPPVTPIVPPGTPYVPKVVADAYPPMQFLVEPDYVVHRRLYFTQRSFERYGWDLGIVTPVVSALTFYTDVLIWPMKVASNPHERYDTSAGKCYPGSPVPLYLYPPEIDLWGVAFGAAIYTGTAALLP